MQQQIIRWLKFGGYDVAHPLDSDSKQNNPRTETMIRVVPGSGVLPLVQEADQIRLVEILRKARQTLPRCRIELAAPVVQEQVIFNQELFEPSSSRTEGYFESRGTVGCTWVGNFSS
eukprot:GABV01010768.1.p1 GENE.GABV01010768.1~~GABV01010768.1.p1  ORF type:complete len:117 (-),score=26.89 GABV01010768.1:36-386(-)